MARIKLDTLMQKLADMNVSDEELGQYFQVDEAHSSPFAPRFEINPETVIVPPGAEGEVRSAQALNAANFFSRLRRKMKFNRKVSGNYKGPVIVSEGDSWFQYPFLLKDTIDHLMDDYAVHSLGAAGDLLQNMAEKREYLSALKETGASILLLSGGGNDLVADGALADHLEAFDPALLPGDYLKPSFQLLLDNAYGFYERMLRDVHGQAPHVHILCHGYDYPLPDKGIWLGKPMETRGIKDPPLQKHIAREMMDRFNRGLLRLCAGMPHVTYINCRNVVSETGWHDELHPKDKGYGDVADLFREQIRALQSQPQSRSRSAPAIVFDGPFGTPTALKRGTQPDTAAQDQAGDAGAGQVGVPLAGRGVSLHIGINEVDPNHYAGWDGKLNACENDAIAMTALATARHFKTDTLLTRDATRDAVVSRIQRAASELVAGDMFLMSISAHGGKLPDLNNDEVDDGDDPQDETLLLYDFMIADDELFALWSEFKEGVRVVLVADTCHSGSMIRATPSEPVWLNGEFVARPPVAVRTAPKDVMARTYFSNQSQYQARASQFDHIKEAIITSPLSTPVKATVLNLGACTDEQFASDGDEYGAFTGALLKTWSNGRFDGSYQSLMKQITRLINRPEQTPRIKQLGAHDPGFQMQQPFSVWPTQAPATTPRLTTSPSPLESAVASGASASTVHQTTHVTGSSDAASHASALLAPESGEDDPVDPSALDALFADSTTASRSAAAAGVWPQYAQFVAFIEALSLRHFSADELLVLGTKHHNAAEPCAGKNAYPPESLWPNIIPTIRALDTLRERTNRPIAITNAYRAPAYNACIGGVEASQHLRFAALDFVVKGGNPIDAAMELRKLRDEEHRFHGGIGLYNTFVHLDSRGVSVDWPRSFAGTSPRVVTAQRDASSRGQQTPTPASS